MTARRIKVAVIGGGCAGMTAAFELSRPEHEGRFDVTVYQAGWRLGGKGASGRGAASRIEEHGFHVWLGFYENSFRILRECYSELGRDPATCPIADWRDAFFPDPLVGIADRAPNGEWKSWLASYQPMDGEPGDPLDALRTPFSVQGYLVRLMAQVRTTFAGVIDRELHGDPVEPTKGHPARTPVEVVVDDITRLLKWGPCATVAAVVEGLRLIETSLGLLPAVPPQAFLRLVDGVAAGLRDAAERMVATDPEMRRLWEITDLTFAVVRGCVREGVLTHPRGLDSLNGYELSDWLRSHGASEHSVGSALVRGLYDLGMAYENGDPTKPCVAAGQALRGAFRMFLTYRGSLFWKMRAGMGDVVFAPLHEVLVKRGVSLRYFHRLEHVGLSSRVAGEAPHVATLEFDVQAETKDGEPYRPLVDVKGLPCWPSEPLWAQLADGDSLQAEDRRFECWWDRRKLRSKTVRVGEDFDLVVLAVGGGAVPYLTSELAERSTRWKAMLDAMRTVETQAFQVWMREPMEALGWRHGAANMSSFEKPFDTWADMRHLIPMEDFAADVQSIVYGCGALQGSAAPLDRSRTEYPAERREAVRRNAIRHLSQHVRHLWPDAVTADGAFRWGLLVPPDERAKGRPKRADATCFDTQFWTANVNPSDRYVLAPPGLLEQRISPLELLFDNLTIAGDWTDSGFPIGCVESAVMSGRLAAHALSGVPRLEDVIGFDHP